MASSVRYARTSDGVDIAFGVEGTGPPLLVFRPLLRPAVDDEFSTSGDEPWLQLTGRGRSIVIWDHRGLGLSNAVPADYTLETVVLDVAAVADAIAVEKFDVLAHVSPCHAAIAFAAHHADRVGRMVLWNPAPPGWSARQVLFADLPDIARTHFREYMELVAIRMIGWDRGAYAQRWLSNMLEHFTPETWGRLMNQMEEMDALVEAASVLTPTLVISDHGGLAAPVGVAETELFRRRLAASFRNGELATLKGDSVRPYTDVVGEFLLRGESEAHERPHTAPQASGTAVILFTDIVESTALTERLGDTRFREMSRALDAGLRAAIRDAGGASVEGKLLGDGVLATFPSAAQAIDGARRCLALSAASELGLHIGLHAGDVIREDGNVFGGAVNIASRICGLCAPGEILVSDVVRGMARSSAGVVFEDRGEQEMKGVGEPVRVYAVRHAS